MRLERLIYGSADDMVEVIAEHFLCDGQHHFGYLRLGVASIQKRLHVGLVRPALFPDNGLREIA